MTDEPWSWMKAVEIAKRRGILEISWRWRDDQKRRAANRAVKKGKLRKVRGKPGADSYKPTEEDDG